MSQRRFLAAAFASIVVFAALGSLFLPFTPDDTYIALLFARNLGHGLGPCFNPGEPSYGFTSPLWVLLLSLCSRFGLDLIWASKGLSFLLGITALILFIVFARNSFQGLPWMLFAFITWATDTWFLRWSPSGMETSLAVVLVLLSFLIFRDETSRKGSFLATGLCVGLTFLVRPEGAGLAVAGGLVLLLERRWKAFARFILGILVVAVPWMVYAQWVFGRIVPNTFSAKTGLAGWTDMLRPLKSSLRILGPAYLFELTGLFLGGVMWLRKKELGKVLRGNLFVLLWVLGLPGYYVLAGVWTQSRYFLLVIPILILFGLRAWEGVLAGKPRGLTALVWVLGLGLVLATNMGLTFALNYPTSIKLSHGEEQALAPIGTYLREKTPPGSRVALLDIGAVSYYSERPIVDLGGLIQPELTPLIRRYPGEKILPSLPGAGYGKPDYYITRTPYPEPDKYPGLTPILSKEYGPVNISDPHTIWTYTLYKIDWDSLGAKP